MGTAFDLSRGETSGLSFKIPEGIHKAAFQPSEWNAIKRDALMAAGWLFIAKYLPKRFTAYARLLLGYRSRLEQTHPKAMAKHLPLVDSGKLRDRMLANAYPQAAAAGKGLFIRTPMAHPLRPQHAAVLQRLTPAELADMNRVMNEQIAATVMDAGTRGSTKNRVRLALTPPQKAAIRAGLKDRGAARYRLVAGRGARTA